MNFKSISFLTISIVIVFASCNSDDPIVEDHCTADRYDRDVFSEVSRTNVAYSMTQGLDGEEVKLLMDIYQPVGDDFEKRPLMIWAFGGGFYQGSRLDMKPLAEAAAKRGYVSASIDYRLLNLFNGFPDTSDVFKIVLMASNDMKAAIRFFRHDAETDNTFRIDPNQIYIGGGSAGSILSIHAAYVGETEKYSIPRIQKLYETLGGYKGDSGLETTNEYGHQVNGVVNLAGAISDIDLIDVGDPPIISYHGDADEVVPFGHADFVIGGIKLFELYGSNSIDMHAKNIGLPSTLYVVEGGDHGGIFDDPKFENDRTLFFQQYFDFLNTQLCM